MKDTIRVILIDPIDESRLALLRVISGVPDLWLAEVCGAYQGAANRVAEIQPDLAIVVMDSDSEQAFDLIQQMTQQSPNVVVLPASKQHDTSVILRVIRAGAREFLTLPTRPEELLESVNRITTRKDEKPEEVKRGPQLIAVTAAAGGVGCTSLAVNLATTLAKASAHETILVDFDLMFGSIDACLDIVTDNTLQGIVQSVDRLDQTLLKRSLTRHSSGLYLLPHPTAMEESAQIDPDALRRVMMMLKASFPTVIIDTSKGLQSSDFLAFEMADVILLAVQLDLTCLRNTARLLHLFQQFEGLTDRVRLVVNRSGAHDSEISLKKAEETLQMPVAWQIPNATKSFNLARARGVPLDEVASGSKAHQAILEIARSLRPYPVLEPSKPRKGLFAAFF
ncbi:AAA family ATPase [Singulisphaera acidiphila]|uniref:Flp pilus assembly protein, ATPase CpaE n=1 Tax=Singulisphaera acidiphila (strain ATCC BAA-1392 / DSM 18658 / VKM B-2454 / MOB10) TaxID=886293 RepID=L0DBT4_SINAD|nr:AAA family ATPase [Singulisphaera acidiphila]AGA26298.1 Flp pilus assembly protein, ATPase CpaE [Singulisphaera acidiphila DSM 18658]